MTRRICILGGITLVISIVAIAIGIFSVSVTVTQVEFPFTAGGAMIAGIPALFLSCCPMAMYSEDKKSRGGSTTGCFDCCTLLMVVWFSITILAIILGFGLSGIYGVVACSNQELKLNACSSAAESKMAISIVTIILTLILFILSLAIFFTCCCNAAKFGMPLLASADSYGYYNDSIERQRYYSRHQGTLSEDRTNNFRSLADSTNVDENNRTIHEPSAPNVSDIRQQFPEASVTEETGPNPSDRVESLYTDPPPSYDEVMKKEQTFGTPV